MPGTEGPGRLPIGQERSLRNFPASFGMSGPMSLTAAVREAVDRFGLEDVPGILKCFSARPEVLLHFTRFADALLLGRGHLSRKSRELVATYVSALNGSAHCTDRHGRALEQEGGDPRQPIELANGNQTTGLSSRDLALLVLAGKVTRNAQHITPADVDEVRVAGWSDAAIAEGVLLASYFNFMNRVAGAFGVPSEGLLDLC